MRDSLSYRLSLGLSILLSLGVFFTLITSGVALASGWGKLPLLALLPWKPLLLAALAAANCSLRKRVLLAQG